MPALANSVSVRPEAKTSKRKPGYKLVETERGAQHINWAKVVSAT